MSSNYSSASRLVVLGGATAIGLVLAVFCGRLVAQENYTTIAMIVGAIAGLTIFVSVGKNAYIMLAVAVGMTGSISALPLPFSYQELMIFGCFGITLTQLAFKKLSLRVRWNYLDFFLFLNLIYMVTVYARNPAGFRALGTEIVGARPYLVVFVAVLFYISVIQYKLPTKLAPRFPLIVAAPIIVLGLIAVLAHFVPSVGRIVYPFWSGVGLDQGTIEAAGGMVSGTPVDRIPTMQIGTTFILLLCSYMPVSHFISPMNPLMLFIFLLSIACWLASGFRSGSMAYIFYMFYNCYLRRRLHDLVPAIGVGLILVCFLIVGQGSFFNLPTGMQRSLSFLPGDWDDAAASDAESSTQWRLDIWKTVLEDDEFIKNKLLGDGFGFSAYDLKIQIDAVLGLGGYMDGTKAQLITGAYHSGPLSAVRYVGYVGLFLYFLLQVASLAFATKLVRQAWNTPYRAIALYLAVPLFYALISYYFIFGGYDSDFPRSVFTVGLLKFVDLSLTDYLKETKAAQMNPVQISEVAARPLIQM